jgi:hypothetical protein
MTMKTKISATVLLFALLFIGVRQAEAALAMSSSTTKVPRGQNTLVTLSYRVSSGSLSATTMTSPQGFFRVAGAAAPVTLGTGGTALSIAVSGGNGSATETVVVPLGVIERALALRKTQFYFERTFTTLPFGGPTTQRVFFQIVSEAASDLTIKTMDLYFENRRPEVTIERGHRGLKAFADISYSGTGLFEGYWEVDGRVLSRVFEHLSFGGVLRLQTPDVPEIPTFDPGSHRVRFVVTRPTQILNIPTLIYFVDLNTFKPAYVPVMLVTPEDGGFVSAGAPKFEWQRPVGKASFFLVQFGEQLDTKAVFSAYTKDLFYMVPTVVAEGTFKAGQQYFWKVVAFDEENNIVGESSARPFVWGK